MDTRSRRSLGAILEAACHILVACEGGVARFFSAPLLRSLGQHTDMQHVFQHQDKRNCSRKAWLTTTGNYSLNCNKCGKSTKITVHRKCTKEGRSLKNKWQVCGHQRINTSGREKWHGFSVIVKRLGQTLLFSAFRAQPYVNIHHLKMSRLQAWELPKWREQRFRRSSARPPVSSSPILS
ncbi:uncharacterized protein LOC144339461 [Macaca mulatta]